MGADAPVATVNANWAAMKAAVSLPAPFKRQGNVVSTAAPAGLSPPKGPEARGIYHHCISQPHAVFSLTHHTAESAAHVC